MGVTEAFLGKKETAIARVTLYTDMLTYPDEKNRSIAFQYESNVYDANDKLTSSVQLRHPISTTFGQLKDRSFSAEIPNAGGTTTTFTATGEQIAALIKVVGYTVKQEHDAARAECMKPKMPTFPDGVTPPLMPEANP